MTAVPQKDLFISCPASAVPQCCAQSTELPKPRALVMPGRMKTTFSPSPKKSTPSKKKFDALSSMACACPTRAANADTTSFRASPNRHKGAKDTKECAGFQKRRYNCSQVLR